MKRKLTPEQEHIREAAKAGRRASRDAQLASGVRFRAQTFADRRKVADKRACRGRTSWD